MSDPFASPVTGRVGLAFASAVRDARHGCRVVWRSPSFALVVVLTIALGIGINVAVAARLWGGNAIGKRLAIGERTKPLEVVGVTAPIRARQVRDEGTPMIYVPYHVYEIEQTLVVKTQAPVAAIGPAIKRTVEALGPGRPVFGIRPMREIVEASIDDTRFTMLVARPASIR